MEPRPPVTPPSRPVTQTHPSNPVAPSGLPAPTRARPVARPSVTHGAPPARGATLPVGDPNLSVQAGCALLSARPPGRLAPPSRHAGCALGDPARRARRILRPPECPPAQALASVPEPRSQEPLLWWEQIKQHLRALRARETSTVVPPIPHPQC